LACCCCALAQGARVPAPLARFTLRDYLNRDWQNELVTFAVEPRLAGRKDLVLLDDSGKVVAFQWSTNGGPAIAFLASVPKLGRAEYRLAQGRTQFAPDLEVREGADFLELASGEAGVRLNKNPMAARLGPIAGVRLGSGRLVGAGELHLAAPPKDFAMKVLSRGPVYADVESQYSLAGNGYWRIRFRVIAGEPVILVDEQFNGPAGGSYVFKLNESFNADHLLYRNGSDAPTMPVKDVPGETAFLLEPWLKWWGSMRGNWCGFYSAGGPDFLAVGLRDPACWVQPDKTTWPTSIEVSKAGLALSFQLRGTQRKWMLVTLPKERALEPSKGSTPLPQQFLIKHGDFPLQEVRNEVLEWPDRGLPHPRLFVTPTELESFRARFNVDTNHLAGLRRSLLHESTLDDFIAYSIASRDPELLNRLSRFALEQLQLSVDLYLKQAAYPTVGTDPPRHYNEVSLALNVLDSVLGPGTLSPGQRQQVRAQVAFLGYTLASPAVISPERGFSANPNMTTSMRCMLGILACLIPDHPQAKAWAEMGISEMANELENWTGPNGGWLEAPHYMTVSMDAIVPLALALRQTTFTQTDWARHPKLKNAIRWLAAISTPPDPRLEGRRRMPEIGNTYTGERTCLPGWIARICKAADPAFARQMQWVWKQHGSFNKPGIGGLYPGLLGYSAFVFDPAIPPEAPQWGSEWFPEAGAVLRAHFPGGCETYLHYIQGRLHQHYDYDEGSFILWGKGAPLCEDFGYYGRALAADHSRVDDGYPEDLGNEGKIREFLTSERADYLHGERAGWHRQILYAKDKAPLGPNYFFICDSLRNGRAGDWRVWFATDAAPAVDLAQPARVSGRFGVDLAVFFTQPSAGALSTEELSRTTGASGFKSRVTTQHSLHLRLPANGAAGAVLYPITREQASPKFTALADGQAVKIESSFGTDYAFEALEPFECARDLLTFHGRRGLVQIRSEGVYLSLLGEGRLTYGDRTLVNDGPAAKTQFIAN
jgi:hypothetical protein